MRNVSIVVMGKTGAGKSTLINSVLNEKVAPTGTGCAVTKENKIYVKCLPFDGEPAGILLSMYDTVGLEINESITKKTINEIKKHIETTKLIAGNTDVHIVWFCVNNRSNRMEPYELNLIKQLSIEHEIPFIITVTQCFSDEPGELASTISKNLAEIPQVRVLAEDYKLRSGSVKAFGVRELMRKSIRDYKSLKVRILEKKLAILNGENVDHFLVKSNFFNTGLAKVKRFATRAEKEAAKSWFPIPLVRNITKELLTSLNELFADSFSQIYGSTSVNKHLALASLSKDLNYGILDDILYGIDLAITLIPGLSGGAAYEYVYPIGHNYLEILEKMFDLPANTSNEEIKRRIKAEIAKLKN